MVNSILQKALAVFLKLGGTWDMVQRQDGTMAGSGTLDDDAVRRMEQEVGLDSLNGSMGVNEVELALAGNLYENFERTVVDVSAGDHFQTWCPKFGKLIDAPFVPLYSGDSSHLRHSFVAAMILYIIEQLKSDYKRIVLGAQGTDTADIALLGLIDAFLFDTLLPPVILAGANRSHREPNSDAPVNFTDLAQVCRVNLGSGAFWVFGGNVFHGCDLWKIDPTETRLIENQSTFFSSHQSAISVKALTQHGRAIDPDQWMPLGEGHFLQGLSLENLYSSLESVYTIDLGSQNPLTTQLAAIHNPDHKVIIIAAHSLGNVSNPIRNACVQVARTGKLIIDSSRCLIGSVNVRYAGSLLCANSEELLNSDTLIVGAHKLNKSMARAVAVRALLEGLNQMQTQELFDRYCGARDMI